MTFSFKQHSRLKATTLKTATIAVTTLTATFAVLSEAAQALTFSFTGGLQSYTVPTSGTYTITTFGAQGGSGIGGGGGLGGKTGGAFSLTQGQILSILVGGQGGRRLHWRRWRRYVRRLR